MRDDKTVCKDIALQRERREEIWNNIVTYCVMLFDTSSWSQKHSFTNTTYIHLAWEYWVSSRSYEMHHLANMWKQRKQKDETFITMNPHNWKYYQSHTVLMHIQYVCILDVHMSIKSYVIKLAATYVTLPHLGISVTQFRLLSFAQ